MKENLFELLLSFFEKSLDRLKENGLELERIDLAQHSFDEDISTHQEMLYIRDANQQSHRIINDEERLKMTKSSYQFLSRMQQQSVIDSYTFELIMNQILFSDSRIVNLEETKWIVRNILSENMDENHVPFLDLLLYQREEQFTIQ